MSIELHYQTQRSADFSLDVELALPSAGVSVIFGRSGAGKSTLLRSIAGLEKPSHERLSVAGHDWSQLPPHQREVGFVFQEPSLFPHLTVRQNIAYARRRTPLPKNEISPSELGIEHLLDRMPDQLSGGEQQRVAIARALASQPRLLLLDEPLSALDAGSRAALIDLLRRINGSLEIPILYVTHSQEEMMSLGDHLVLLENGRVITQGTLPETWLSSTAHDDRDVISRIEGEVISHDETYGLTKVDFGGDGPIYLSGPASSAGASVRILIRGSDVGLALERPQQSSILNVFSGRIVALNPMPERPQISVELSVGEPEQRLFARITQKSADALALKADQTVWVQVKSVAIG